ncbi:MAG TPA: hypothetical protein VGY54_27295, partial [Polyangiaceae bacterium]|nr:hypothetical protein [Polyangiaceae bacterium]
MATGSDNRTAAATSSVGCGKSLIRTLAVAVLAGWITACGSDNGGGSGATSGGASGVASGATSGLTSGATSGSNSGA